jgi:polyisoprenoid-binding protein YceI
MNIPRPQLISQMKRFAPALAALLAYWSITATGQTTYSSMPGASSVKIDGTSSLHDWEMEGLIIGGTIEFGPGIHFDASQPEIGDLHDNKVPAKSRIMVPVRSVHSKADHLPDVMDGLMQKALKETDFPRIQFAMTDLVFKGPHEAGKPFNFDVTGNLSIAGSTNSVTFPVTIEALDGGKLRIQGTAPVKMTAYGVNPPAPNFGLGMMKCGDDVKVIFDWTVRKRAPAK